MGASAPQAVSHSPLSSLDVLWEPDAPGKGGFHARPQRYAPLPSPSSCLDA
jgi:hypothetical protein